jgi:hypothetical protein
MANTGFGKRTEMGHVMRGEETMAPLMARALAKYIGNIMQSRYSLLAQAGWLTHLWRILRILHGRYTLE